MIHKILLLKFKKKKKRKTKIGKRVRRAQEAGQACVWCWGAQICMAQGSVWEEGLGRPLN